MSDVEHVETHREIEALHRLAMDAHAEGQYATMERLLAQAVHSAERLDDLPLLVRERFWLATAQRMQGQHVAAMSTYTWLIGLATDPRQSQRVADAESLWYLAGAFMNFVDSGRFLPAMPVERLLCVVDEGLAWLASASQSGLPGCAVCAACC
jgi:hypothetical protein